MYLVSIVKKSLIEVYEYPSDVEELIGETIV